MSLDAEWVEGKAEWRVQLMDDLSVVKRVALMDVMMVAMWVDLSVQQKVD